MTKFCLLHEVPVNAVTQICPLCAEIRREENESTKFDERRETEPIEREEI